MHGSVPAEQLRFLADANELARRIPDGAKVRDATCPAIHTALQASEKGVPFMPLGGVIASDLVKGREDWAIASSPFEVDPSVKETPRPADEALSLLRGPVARQVAVDYPDFARRVWGIN